MHILLLTGESIKKINLIKMDQDDDIPTLSADTQAILNQFLAEKVEVEKSQDLFKQENW